MDSNTATMAKDISARHRAGRYLPAGQSRVTASNAETDGLSESLLAAVSAWPALINFTHICDWIWLNYFDAEYALEINPMLSNIRYDASGTSCGNANVMCLQMRKSRGDGVGGRLRLLI